LKRIVLKAGVLLAALSVLAPVPGVRAAARPGHVSAVSAAPADSSAADSSAAVLTALETESADSGLRPEILQLALRSHARALAAQQTTSPIMTVIDYSLPSRERRLWVLDLEHGNVLAHELVAHGKGTGDDQARAFSNTEGSNQSSLGTFVTGATYQGKHGLSLRLRGLDASLNSNAEARGIVVHAADYVNQGIVAQLGRLGRSQGCPALNPAVAPRIIGLIKGGTVVFSYFPAPALTATLPA
jgi:hypothetical protein